MIGASSLFDENFSPDVVDEKTLQAIVNQDGGSMTPTVVDAVLATNDLLEQEETSDCESTIVSTTVGSISEGREFLLRIFNPGSQPARNEHHVFHRFHTEDAMPIEGYLG